MLEKHVWRDFFAVTLSIGIVGIGLGCTLPLTALVLTHRGFGPDMVGWMIAASALGGVTGTFAMPSLAVRFGRRKVMFGCYVLAAASVIPLQYTTSILVWIVLRFLYGISMATLFLIGEAWINILSGDSVRGRIVAIYTTTFTLFQVAGPLLTNLLSRFTQNAFLLCGALFLLGVPGIMIARDNETPYKLDSSGGAGQKIAVLPWADILRKAMPIIAATAFFASFDSIVLSFLPLAALDSGFSQSRALGAPSIVLAGDAALQYLAGWLSDHYGRGRVHILCGLIVCLMLPMLPLMIHIPVLWEIYLFLLGGVAGAVYTLAMVATGDYFSGAALLRVSGLIGLTWNVSSSSGPAATGLVMRQFGSPAMVAVLWVMAMMFLASSVRKAYRFSKLGETDINTER